MSAKPLWVHPGKHVIKASSLVDTPLFDKRPPKPLTERMHKVLGVLAATDVPLTPNRIASKLGFTSGHLDNGPKCNHAGRTMGPAQRIIGTLTALRKRGLIVMRSRLDGFSGTAYEITPAGRRRLRRG